MLEGLIDPEYMEIALKVNQGIGASLDNNTPLRSLYYSIEKKSVTLRDSYPAPAWWEFMESVTFAEKSNIRRALGPVIRKKIKPGRFIDPSEIVLETLGDLREIPLDKLVALREVSSKRAAFLLLAFQSKPEGEI